MNIPYEQIKAKALEREHALRDLESHLAHLEGMSERLLESLRYFKALQDYANLVDTEGLALIPGLGLRIYRVTNIANRMFHELHTSAPDLRVGVLTDLRQAVREP